MIQHTPIYKIHDMHYSVVVCCPVCCGGGNGECLASLCDNTSSAISASLLCGDHKKGLMPAAQLCSAHCVTVSL